MGLTVKRRTGERVLIGEDVVVEVTAIGASRVELHVAAPDDVRIRRAGPVDRDPEHMADDDSDWREVGR